MKQRDHRGVSVGTVVMLTLTVLVLGVSGMILPRLMGTANIRMDAGSFLAALNLGDAVPALSLSEIPITDATAVPAVPGDAVQITPAPTRAATNTPIPTATPQPGGTLTLTLGGSIVIDDGIRKSAYYSDSGKYDFREILSLLSGEMDSDLTLLALDNVTDPESKVSALNAPVAVMDMLSAAGVDMVSLGFSKACDKGAASLRATIAAAQESRLATVGAYQDESDASTLRIVTINNVDVAVIHGTDSITATGKKKLKTNGGAWMLPLADAETLTREIARAREAGADVVIVSINWGVASFKQTNRVKQLAQTLADAGADIIIGTGTASVQPVTWLTGKRADGTISQTLCAWSLGTLLSSGRSDHNVAGMLLQLQVSYDGSAVSFGKVCCTPTYIWRYKQDGQYQYRIAASDRPAPDGMSSDHIGYMEKALNNILKKLKDSPVTLRENPD